MKGTLIRVLAVAVLLQATASAADTLPYKKAQEIGVKKCLAKVGEISDFILKEAGHGADTIWNKNVDGRLFSFFVSRGYADGDSQVSMHFAPNGAACDAVYTETMLWETSCALVREEVFKAWKFRGSLNGKTMILQNDSGSVDVYLTPGGKASNLCMSTKREVVY